MLKKLVLIVSGVISCATYLNGITIDNQLVSSRHDCFERIAIGAMLPFEKTFRNTDTNSIKICENLCAIEGDNCQTFSLGIHVRGNGTCQLSSEVIDSTRTRPAGTIFDPDFDLYARRNNCIADTPPPPHNGGLGFSPDITNRPSSPYPISTTIHDLPPQPPTIFTQIDTTSTHRNPLYPSTTVTVHQQPETSRPTTFSDRPSTTPETSQGTTLGQTFPQSTEMDRFPQSTSSRFPQPTDGPKPQTTDRYTPPMRDRDRDRDRYPSTNKYPTRIDGDRYPSKDQYPEKYPNKIRPYSPNGYEDKGYTPLDRPINYPLYEDRDARPVYDQRGPLNDRFNHYPEYPNYDYPMPYEKNYPMPNEKDSKYGNSYANKYPPMQTDYYRPSTPEIFDYSASTYDRDRTKYNYNYGERDRYGPGSDYLNYGYGQGGSSSSTSQGNGFSYTPSSYGSSSSSTYQGNGYDNRPIKNTNRPADYDNRPDTMRPNRYDNRPNGYDNTNNRPSTDQANGYGQRPISSQPSTSNNYQPRPEPSSQRPNDSNNGYTTSTPAANRPIAEPSSSNNGYSSGSNPDRPDPPSTNDKNTNKQSNSGGSSSGNTYHVTEEPIKVYFNPESYYNLKPKPPLQQIGSSGYGSASSGSGASVAEQEACFRRVLAGKRVAPLWVRRTLACERIEDCQRECGEEKRFMCEGFNYRIDPSGHGQGICELVEVPLSGMDLYSSPHSRDSNLLRHPDYDYYERDRNAPPGCSQPIGCIDCSYLKPYRAYRPLQPQLPQTLPDRYKPYPDQHPGYDYDRYRPPQTTAIDKYRPPPLYENRPQSGYNSYDFQYSNYYSNDDKYNQYNKPYELDRYDPHRPDYRPTYGEIEVTGGRYRPSTNYQPRPDAYDSSYDKQQSSYGYRPTRPQYNYLDRGDPPSYNQNKPSGNFIPYLIGTSDNWGVYGGNYGTQNQANKGTSDYWGIRNELKRNDGPQQFNYNDLGKDRYNVQSENSVWNYPGGRYGNDDKRKVNYGSLWTRRPGIDECSVKSSEGFRLHKGVIRTVYNAPDVRECEKMCFSENKFKCNTYSYRYSNIRENCLLCDRPYNHLDYYADLEPDRDYDIYSMTDDPNVCKKPASVDRNNNNNAQCFFRAVDSSRFFKSIIRDSLTVRSVGECEMECIKSAKFTCRAFTFRYGSIPPGNVIDNCQLSDWPVKDMDKERHLILDNGFDVFERASYGHGCEVRPIVDPKHQKLCYLGYGSPAKLLSSAIKKVISVPTELDCKNECTRFRETSLFKCLAFSYGSHASTFNCELSDLDQSELKLNIHYAHTNDRDFWLFAWNPFDYTCRDKVTTIGGGNRINNDRRMDIFRDPGEATWKHFTVSGKPCRIGTQCERNSVSGFYSCEIEGGEISAWDYCCRDDHPCGYSQGFEYPWCFVGDGPDQWRKCSDRYFPVKKDETNSIQSSTTTKLPDRRKGDIHQLPPRPGGLHRKIEFGSAKIWPVTFFYTDGPPNSTELSNAIDCKREHC